MPPNDPLLYFLQNNSLGFHNVVPFTAAKDQLLLMDFTEKNTELTDDILRDTQRFTKYVNEQLASSGSCYGIGGYGEHRAIYRVSSVFNSQNNEEPRRLHLGIDIWGKPFTKVMAPLDGMVHSFAFNNKVGDYGATIILVHHIEGCVFHTLHGHLSLASIKNLNAGDRIQKGDVFAEFGIPQENGSWPPHLHFQIIKDMQGMMGDYPGVCKYSEKKKFMENCPDPDLILNMMKYAVPDNAASK